MNQLSNFEEEIETRFIYFDAEIAKKLLNLCTKLQQFIDTKSQDVTVLTPILTPINPFLSKESFIYKKVKQSIDASTMMLQIAENLVTIINLVEDLESNTLIYNSLFYILQRREFDVKTFKINIMGEVPKITCSNNCLNIMRRYKMILLRTLRFTIIQFPIKKLSFSTTNFCISIIAIGYFFINSINSKVVNAICPVEREMELFNKFPEIKEIINFLKKQPEALEDSKQVKERTQQVFYHMKWALSVCSQRSNNELREIEDTISVSTFWAERLGDIFTQYRVISEIINIASYLVPHVQWHFVPGYYELISPFLVQMKKEAPYFSKNTISLSKTLLKNLQILNAYLEITLRSTNVYEVHGTTYTLSRLNEWFTISKYRHYLFKFPSFINFDIVHEALVILFESEHYNILTATLSFLYATFNSFPEGVQSSVIHNIFLPNFNRIFLHWNRDVRLTFMHILVFQVARREEIDSSPLHNLCEFGKPVIMRRMIVRDENYERLIFDKLSILQIHIQKSKKLPMFPKANIKLAIEDYRGVLQLFENWDPTLCNQHGDIEYPVVQSTSLPEG